MAQSPEPADPIRIPRLIGAIACRGTLRGTRAEQHNVEVKLLNDETLGALAKLTKDVVEEEASKGEMSRRMLDSLQSFRGMVAPYTSVADTEFLKAREKFAL